jgi:hypothetical protein
MKYAAEMNSGAMIHTRFHKDWFCHSDADGGGGDTQTAWRSHKPTLIIFQNKESRLKRAYHSGCAD